MRSKGHGSNSSADLRPYDRYFAARRAKSGGSRGATRVSVEDIDPVFGVVTIDPEKGTYAVQVKGLHPNTQHERPGEFRGPWSNPRIEPFGPVRNGSN